MSISVFGIMLLVAIKYDILMVQDHPAVLEMYNVYLQTKGNKPLLFGGGTIEGSPSTDLSGVDFVNGERQGNQNIVDIALPLLFLILYQCAKMFTNKQLTSVC